MSQNNRNDLIFQKEKEWRDLLVSELEESKNDRDRLQNENEDLMEKFNRLKSDFTHNLRVLDEAENDLREMEKENEVLRESVGVYEEKISELSVEIARLKDENAKVQRVMKEMKDKVDEVREKANFDMRVVREEKIKEVDKVRREMMGKIRELELALTEAEERRIEEYKALEEQEEARDKETRKERDNSHWRVVQEEMKYRLVSKELEICRGNKAELVAELAEKEDLVRMLEMRMSEFELATASEASIFRMKAEQNAMEAHELQIKLEKEIEKLSRKLQNREDTMKGKVLMTKKLETELRNVLNDASEKECALEKEIKCLKEDLEKERDALFEEKRICSGKDSEITRLVSKMNEEVANREGELRNVKVDVDLLRKNLREKQEELLELRNELEYAVGRDIEQSRRKECDKVSLEVQLEKVRIEEMAKVEGMIKSLTKTRDDALAEVRELRKQADDRKEVRICTQCSQNSLKETEFRNVEQDQVKQLQDQNEQLKEVISRMTEETTKELKTIPTTFSTNNKHIAILAERNRQLQQEKIELLAASRKLQARFEGAEAENSDMKRIVRERDTEISQIRFELDSLKRHSDLDTRTLRRRTQELETELAMSRKEAGEYYKGNLELGRVVEDLQSELTYLKSEDFGQVPSLNFGAQEMIIEQLKKEISDLRCKLSGSSNIHYPEESNRSIYKEENKEMKVLRSKLKLAANHIKNLATEKQVLIQISNRLRSELKQAGMKINSDGTNVRHTLEYKNDARIVSKDVGHTMNDMENKLSQLEKLHRDARNNYGSNQIALRTSRDGLSSVGRRSVEDVFKLLDDSDSLGRSSIYGPDKPESNQDHATISLSAKTVKLNPAKINAKRNMITNRK